MKGILFDWDGVIADSFDIHLEFINKMALKFFGLKDFMTKKQYREEEIKSISQKYETIGFDWKRDEKMIFKEYFEYMDGKEIPMKEGMDDAIKQLSKTYRVGIVTSNHTKIVRANSSDYGILSYIECIISADDPYPLKPEPDALIAGCKRLGLDNDQSYYVGDNPVDIRAAHGAKMNAIGTTWGWSPRKRLKQYSPFGIIDEPKELVDLLLSKD